MAKKWVYLPVRPNEKAKIDIEDLNRCSKHTWRVVKKPSGRKKVVTNIIEKDGRNRQISLGQFLMKAPKGKMVYPRRFMEGFDYRKENLLVCTIAERQRILPPSRNRGSSRYKGVSYIQSLRRWRASIQFKGKAKIIGHYKDEHDAARAYNRAARELFADYAYQNQVSTKKKRRLSDR